MKNLIIVTIGDIDGIGIKILLNLWKEKKERNFILITNLKILKKYLNKNKIKIKINSTNDNAILDDHLNIFEIKARNNAENSYNSILKSYKIIKIFASIGILTLPVNKKLLNKKINKNFKGQTELYQKMDNKKDSNMMFLNKKFIFFTLTTHLPLVKVNNKLFSNNYIYKKIILLYKTLQIDFNIEKPKLVISGLNPHAGEDGVIGIEEIKYIKPILSKLKKININVDGPRSADTLINYLNLDRYDTFIFPYHDQALIPFKLLSKFRGVNYTGGLDIIRVSPDHGTAYGLKDSKKIINKGVLNCFKYIKLIHKNREKFANTKKILRSKLFN